MLIDDVIYWYNNDIIVYNVLLCSCHYHIHMSIITQDGYTALMKASREGMTEVVDQLINAGATLDLQDDVCYVVVSHDVILL